MDAAVAAFLDLEHIAVAGPEVISAGCPMMCCCPDGFHKCAKAVFRFFGRIPGDIDV